MGTAPSDITVSSLLSAKKKELVFWIKQANQAASNPSGKRHKGLTQQGNVLELREKLAVHYKLDLTSAPKTEAVVGLLSMDMQLQQAQWAYLRALGEQWKAKADSGQPFLLLHGECNPRMLHCS